MSTAVNNMPDQQGPILAVDQENACERLLALARVRAMTTLETLPVGVLSHWSVPLLVGPSASGKAFVCAEAARRWGDNPCCRWEVSSWTLASNRTNQGTFEQLQAYVAGNPGGCIVYLAGIDTLAAASEHHASYALAVAGEIAHFLTQATARPASFPGRDGSVVPAQVLVVVGGCFAALWGETSVGGPDHREAWRHADADPLADGHAVAQWLWNDSSLPAGILRRLAPEPLVLRSLDRAEADRLAERLRDRLPSSLDGLGADEFSRALQSSSGWRAVAAVVEQAWVAGHEPLILAAADEPSLPPAQTEEPSIEPEQVAPVAPELPGLELGLPPAPLGLRLGLPANRSRLIAKARRLGLRTVWHVEWLAAVRGYLLSGEDMGQAAVVERVGRHEFSDTELVATLLSPCLESHERVICRGALMLSVLVPAVAPESIVYEARRARGELVVRHVVWIGAALHPQHRCWRDLVCMLPSIRTNPALAPGVMPDEAIRRVLSTSPR